MRFSFAVQTLVAVVLVGSALQPAFAQTQALWTPPPTDPLALSIAQQAIAALGGFSAIGQISDLTSTGQFTKETVSPPMTDVVRTYVKGKDRVRMETDTANGLSFVVYAQGQGFHSEQGNEEWLRTHSVVDRGLEQFPAFRLAVLLTAPQVSVSMGDVTRLNGEPVYEIKICRVLNFDALTNSMVSHSSRVEFLIDQKSYLPLRLRYYVHPEKDARVDWSMDITYSDYRPIQGVLMPFAVTQSFSGQQLGEFQISAIQANTGGLSDSLFEWGQP